MNAVIQAGDWYQHLLQTRDRTSLLDQTPWTRQVRDEAQAAFLRRGFPDKKQEAWRYSGIQGLLTHHFVPAQPGATTVQQADVDRYAIHHLDAHRLVFVDNCFRADLSALDALPHGVVVQGLTRAVVEAPTSLQTWLGQAADAAQNAFVALNTALMADGLFIHVHDHVRVDKPIEVLYLTTSRDALVSSMPRVLVILSPGARATLVERFRGQGETPYFQNLVEEVVLHDGAELAHYRLVEEQAQGYHLSHIDVRQEGGSRYRAMNLDLGGAWLRSNYQVNFQGQGADCELQGLYLVGERQHTNVHTHMLHHVPACRSRQHFKGLLLGAGRAVFDGRILVDKQAQLSDAHLANDNLMLSEAAEVDTKPQLEIYADNVQCSHGTTVGQLEAEQLFYLRSRGIPEADATRMLCQGFASAVLEACTIAPLRHHVESRIQQSLDANARALRDAV
jgi:Fe-S cluster assembly protein SufD